MLFYYINLLVKYCSINLNPIFIYDSIIATNTDII